MLFCRQFGFQRRRWKRLKFYMLFFWIKAKKSVVWRRLDSFQNVHVVLACLFWTLSSSRFKQNPQTSWTRLVFKTTFDQMPSFPFSAFWRLVCFRVIFSNRKSFYVFIAFYITIRSFVKEKVHRLLFGISFSFRSYRTGIWFNLQLCSSRDTTEVPSSNCHTRRFARMWYRSHGIHRFSNLFMMSGETLSLHEYSRLLVFEI